MTRDDIIRMAREAGVETTLALGNVLVQIAQASFDAGAAAEREVMINDGWRQCAQGQRTTQFCGAAEQARADEREACAQIAWERFGTAGREIAETIRKRGK